MRRKIGATENLEISGVSGFMPFSLHNSVLGTQLSDSIGQRVSLVDRGHRLTRRGHGLEQRLSGIIDL